MRAVNLVPAEARPGRVSAGKSGGMVYASLGVLVVLLAGLSLLAVTKRDKARAEQQLANVQQSTQAYSQVASQYASFEKASADATQRIKVVRSLADARFDWAGSLRELARLIPASTQVSKVDASVKPGLGGAGSSLRGQVDSPAITLTVCSKTQTTVADLVTNLQAMRRVTNVSLESSEATDAPMKGTTDVSGATDSSSDSGDAADACSLAKPYYNATLTVFFAAGNAQASADISPAAGGATTVSTESAGGTVTPASTTPTTAGN